MKRAASDWRWIALLESRATGRPLPDGAAAWPGLFALYRDQLQAASADGLHVVAHLGQSLDGRIATASGHSAYVTGPEDLVHMHRLRALADAVLVGGGTVFHDDPQLTVRLCDGPSPVRVVLDPWRRLGTGYRVFQDQASRTLLLTRPENLDGGRHGHAEVVAVQPGSDGAAYCPRSVLRALAGLGLRRLLIEGGGATVACFWQHDCLDRVDLCVAPVVIGQGRDALPLPSAMSMQDAERFRPECLPLGDDRLYVLRRARRPVGLGPGQEQEVAMADPEPGGAQVASLPP
ncbi:RibD family protein [Geminicoccus harenae]|uniref:RibD family protein n=1 Tax=Geminicoccus harenae TaxID=2498453 RepID=UPI00168B4FE0|nr:RibD family protein [Geminicoccus harenae]